MKKKQLQEALQVLRTKLSSARDNPLLMDNYAVKALRAVLLNFKKSGELHEAYKEQIQSDNVIKCCAIELQNGELSIKREDVLGKSRAENLVMTRCMVVEQMIHAGFSITTIATVLNRTVTAVRHLCKMVYTYIGTSRVWHSAGGRQTSSERA